MLKVFIKKPITANITLNGERLEKAFPRSGTRQGYPLLLLLFNNVLEILAGTVRQEREIKASDGERKKSKRSLFVDDRNIQKILKNTYTNNIPNY